MQRKIPLFDLGNVLIQVNFAPFFAWLERQSDPDKAYRMTMLLESSLFFDFEFGNISQEEFYERCCKLLGAECSQAEFYQNFNEIFPGPMEGMPELLEELKATGPVYLLSNTNQAHAEKFLAQFPWLQKMDRLFLSHEMRKRKPYPGIYRELAHSIEVEPKQICFLDDREDNILGAHRAGLEAHVFQGVSHARQVLLEPIQV